MSTTNPGSKPAGSTNSSSVAATVVVTARDIEFSNYNSTTNKWGGAVMTMMVLDAVTEDLQGYDEKVYAVFKNHDDPTDLIQFSAEIDGLDSRVSTTTPMVPSAKYELYKIYGQTSGQEYTTTSQFYFQTPGRIWDFANDTVGDEDITLVSDWFNYGEIEDTNGNVYGMTTKDEAIKSALGYGTNFTVNGTELERSQVYRYKLTSMTEGRFVIENSSYGNCGFFAQMPNLTKFDIVSSKITSVGYTPSGSQVVNAISSHVMGGTNITHRFAFPETMEGFFPVGSITANYGYNQPIYVPPRIGGLVHFLQDNSTYNSKVIISNRCRSYTSYSFYLASNVNPIIDWEHMETPPSIQNLSTYSWGYNRPITIPAVWGVIPENFLYNWPKWEQGSIVIPEGITQVRPNCFTNVHLLNNFSLPSTLTSISNGCFSNNGYGNSSGISINLEDTAVTSIGNACFNGERFVNFELPSTLTTIGNNFLHLAGLPDQTVLDIPEGVTSIGNGFLSSLYVFPAAGSITINFPSTLTSIGTGILNGISNFIYFGHGNLTVDLSNVSPSVFPDNDIGGFTWFSQNNNSTITIKIAPGTLEQWQAKYPDNLIPSGEPYINNYRKIVWEEPSTQYGFIIYKKLISTSGGVNTFSEWKSFELESASELEQLKPVNDGSSFWHNNCFKTTIRGETFTNCYPSGSAAVIGRNYIVGVIVGTDITTIPELWMANSSLLGDGGYGIVFGENVVTIYDGVLCRSGKIRKIEFKGDKLRAIGGSFCYGSILSSDADITFPEGLETLGVKLGTSSFMYSGQIFLYSPTSSTYHGTVTFPNSLTSLNAQYLFATTNTDGVFNFQNLPASVISATTGDCFATREDTSLNYTVGVTIKGTNSAAIISRFGGNLSGPSWYRTFIDGGV